LPETLIGSKQLVQILPVYFAERKDLS